MQRFLSAAVLVSVGALAPAHAAAQASPAPAGAGSPNTSKPIGVAAGAAGAAKAPPAKPASPPSAAAAKKPDDRLSDDAELARVVGLYEAGKYRECDTELEHLLDPTNKSPLRLPPFASNSSSPIDSPPCKVNL